MTCWLVSENFRFDGKSKIKLASFKEEKRPDRGRCCFGPCGPLRSIGRALLLLDERSYFLKVVAVSDILHRI